MSVFFRVDAAIETCSRHLESSATDPEVEAILAGHIAAIAYASYEKHVRDLIAERCLHPTDQPINNFASVASQRLVRSIKIGELSGFLGFFGDSHKRSFQDALAAETEAAAAWDSLLTGRHGIAHENSAPSLTFADVTLYVVGAEKILGMFEAALNPPVPQQ